jgi:hypothetical protein
MAVKHSKQRSALIIYAQVNQMGILLQTAAAAAANTESTTSCS